MKKGFTLIEMVLVVGILLVIMSVGIHSLNLVSRFNNSKYIEEIAGNIRYARNLALANKEDCMLTFNEDNTYTIIQKDFVETYDYSKEITNNLSGKIIRFNRRGAPHYKTSQTLVFYTKNRKYEITITPVTGEVNIK